MPSQLRDQRLLSRESAPTPLRQRGASVQSLPLSQLPLTCPATSYPGRNPLCPFSDKHPVCLSLHKPRDRGLTCSQAAWPIVRDL